MDRVTVYPGAIPLETDILNTNKNSMFAIGQLSQDVFGTSTVFTGLACVPNSPAALNVIVQPGAVYAQAALDATAYSSLASDSTTTQKQGILKTAQTFATPAPATSGKSIVYLISAAFLEVDTNAVVLPYYNASNPAQAYSGPSNSGTSQNTTRQDTVQLTLTAGVAANTGSQLPPATPAGQIALYTITVAFGATTVVAGNIAQVSGAPFLPLSLLQLIQQKNMQVFTSSGTFNVPAWCTKVKVKLWAGGAGGGGANQAGAAAGGGAGGYSEGVFTVTPGAAIAVTVGAGGAGGTTTPTNGTNGGSSSFGALCSATGGTGGQLNLGGISTVPGGSGIGSNGQLNLSASAIAGQGYLVTTGNYIGGTGAAAIGGSVPPPNYNSAGTQASGVGNGGNGASGNFAGGAGSAGLVIVEF